MRSALPPSARELTADEEALIELAGRTIDAATDAGLTRTAFTPWALPCEQETAALSLG